MSRGIGLQCRQRRLTLAIGNLCDGGLYRVGHALRRAQRRRIGRRRVGVAIAAPLRRRQQAVGIGPLPQPEPALGVARLLAPALPVQQPEIAQPGERVDDGAAAAAGLVRDRVERRVEPAGAVVQEVEQQHVQHAERGAADDAAMPAGLARLAIPSPGLVPELRGLLAGHRRESHRAGDAAAPYGPGRAGLGEAGQNGGN